MAAVSAVGSYSSPSAVRRGALLAGMVVAMPVPSKA
jgi:hypothetical protein